MLQRKPDTDLTVPGGAELIPSGPSGLGPIAAQATLTLDFLGILWAKKWWILLFLLLGAGGGVAWVLLQPATYASEATVEVVGFNQSFMGMNQVDPQAGTDSYSASASNIQTQMRILTSPTVLGRTIERMDLETTPIATTATDFWGRLRAKLPLQQREPLELTRAAIRAASRSTSTRALGATRLVSIRCESTSPEIASAFLNTLVAEHISQGLAARSTSTQRTTQWMEGQLEEAKARLQKAGERLQQFVRESGVDFFPEQATLADTKLHQLQSDLSSVQSDRIARQSKLELAKNTPPESLPTVLNDANLMSIQGQIATLRQEMAPLAATYTPQYYKVQRIQVQINELTATLEKERQNVLKRLQAEYDDALRRERMLGGAYGSQTRAVGGQAEKASQYAMLRRDVELAQQIYNTLLQQANQAALLAMVPSANIRVIDQALPNPMSVSPNPVRDIATCSIAAPLGIYAFFLLIQFLRIKRASRFVGAPGQVGAMLGVMELGVIPSSVSTEPAGRSSWRQSSKKTVPSIILNSQGEENQNESPSLELETWQRQRSMLSESFRYTLASILRSRRSDHNPVYVVTSPGPGEGKTTLSTNLAIAMANNGHRALLIDGDIRRPRLHSVFGLPIGQGFSELLSTAIAGGAIQLGEYLKPTNVPKLTLMTAGSADEGMNPQIFFSSCLAEIVAETRKEFDVVIFDMAPVLRFPDARLVGFYCDGVILVLRSGVTPLESAIEVRARLTADGVPIAGVVLNDWTPEDDGRNAYRSYRYNYYTSPQDETGNSETK